MECHWVLAACKATEEELAVAKANVPRPSAKSKAKAKTAPKSSSGGSGGEKTSEKSQSSENMPKRSPRAPAEPPAPTQPQKRLRGKSADAPSTSTSPSEVARMKKLMEAGWCCCWGTAYKTN